MGGRRVLLAGAALLVAGCAFPHRMERVPPSGRCAAGATLDGPAAGRSPTGLLWFRAATERDTELAGLWCETVGRPVLRLEPTIGRSSWGAGTPLEVVSWNTWIGGGDLHRLLAEELAYDCRRPAGGRVTEGAPFVLLLQEVWRYSETLPVVEGSRIIPWTIDPRGAGGGDPDIAEAARRCGLALVYVPSARNGPDSGSRPREDKGNAILSNLPLSDPLAFDLPLEGGRKVAVAATVAAPDGRTLRVVSMHLDVASTLVRTVFSGNQTRVRQAMGLVDGLARAEQDGYAVDATVVGADMNTWAGNEAALKRMREAFPESPEWDRLATRGVLPTDHIFFRTADPDALGVTAYERIEDAYASDHHPRRVLILSRGASR